MKNARLFLMAILGSITLNSCGETKKENETEDVSMPMQNEMHMEDGDEMEEMGGNLDDGQRTDVEFNNENIAEVYDHYLHIKTALVNTNPEEAQNGGEMLVEALAEVENNSEALEAARTIANTEAVNEQRTAFLDLSTALEDLLTGAVASGEVYKQYCPMAFEGEGGSWFSSSQEVRNPYYGDKMLKCGSVRDTIK